MKSIRRVAFPLFIAIALAVLSGCSCACLKGFGGDDSLAPARDWRYIPAAVASSAGEGALRPLLDGKSVSCPLGRSDAAWIAFQTSATPERLLFTYDTGRKNAKVSFDVSTDSKTGADGSWSPLQERNVGSLLQKFEYVANPSTWYRLRVAPVEPGAAPEPIELSDIGLYFIRPKERADYWLTIGASIQAQSIRQGVFHDKVAELYPGYDPVMFNLAVGGWRSSTLLEALPGFLAEHPSATYVCIHIGGNNVSPNRPYPGGADTLKAELESILVMIRESGKIPILSRLSYRAYKGKLPVPPEENGSGPYVTQIYDPLIQEYCPRFFDPVEGKGIVDAYGWFKAHPEELSPDGIHVNPAGADSWNALWARDAGGVVYADIRYDKK